MKNETPTREQIKEEARRVKNREAVYSVIFEGDRSIIEHIPYGYLVFPSKADAKRYIDLEMRGKWKKASRIIKMKLTR